MKTFQAVSCGAKFHLHLLVQNTHSPNVKLHVNAPSNNHCFAKALKESKPTCLSLICHNLVALFFNYFEVAKFSVTALPFM